MRIINGGRVGSDGDWVMLEKCVLSIRGILFISSLQPSLHQFSVNYCFYSSNSNSHQPPLMRFGILVP